MSEQERGRGRTDLEDELRAIRDMDGHQAMQVVLGEVFHVRNRKS